MAEGFRTLADLLPEALLLVTKDGALVSWNDAAEKSIPALLGETGKRLADLSPNPAAVSDFLRMCMRTSAWIPGALVLDAQPGNPQAWLATGRRYAGATVKESAVALIRLVVKDEEHSRFVALNERIKSLSAEVRRRKGAETALDEERRRLGITLASIGDAVITTDPNGCITFLNNVAEVLTGWRSSDALGRPCDEVFFIVGEESRLPVENPVTRVLLEGRVVGLANHTVLKRRDGTEIAIDDSGAPIRDRDGTVLGAVLVFHDTSDRRILERELRQRADQLEALDRRKDEFLAMLSHELRNPLAPVISALRIIELVAGDNEALRQPMGIMDRQLRHLTHLVNDLLDATRITQGKISLNRVRVDLCNAVRQAQESVDFSLGRTGHQLTVSLPTGSVDAFADPVRITQAIANLVENAIKYSTPDSPIEIGLHEDDGLAVISIRDYGIGIEPDQLEEVFNLFYQSDKSLARTRGGLGIGLSIARKLVELHDGTLELHSKGPGCGTVAIMKIPVLDGATEYTLGSAIRELGFQKKRILVVDDNVDAADSLVTLLELVGHEVAVANSWVAATKLNAVHEPEVVLLDIGLPGLNGYELLEKLRSKWLGRKVLAIAVTGYGRSADRLRSEAAGFDHHLTKPVDTTQLLSLISPQ